MRHIQDTVSLKNTVYIKLTTLVILPLRTRGILRALSNIYNDPFCSEPYVTLTYLEPCHIWNLRNNRNPIKHL